MLANFLINTAQAVSLPNFSQTSTLPAFISSVYSFALTVVGIAIFVQIVRAGFMWLTAAGDTGKAGKGRTMMTNAVIGAILLFAAWLILYIINPDLVKNTFNFSLPPSSQSGAPPTPTQTDPTPGGGAITGDPQETGTFGYHLGLPIAYAQGIYFFTVKVTDALGDSYDQDYTMEIFPDNSLLGQKDSAGTALAGRPHHRSDIARAASSGASLAINTPFVPDGVIGQPYFAEVNAVGGQSPYAFSISEGSLPPGLFLQNTLDMPVLTIQNLTAQRNPPYYYNQTDRFRLTLTNAKPNSIVFYKWQKNNNSWFYPGKTPSTGGWTAFGQTDASGTWVNEANFSSAEVGNWHEWAMVDGKISNAIGFQVVATGVHVDTSGSVTPAPIPPGSQGGSSFTPCTLNVYCESKTDPQATSSPGPSGCGDTGNQIETCYYPSQDPSSICRTFDTQYRTCTGNLSGITSDSGLIDYASLPVCGSSGLKPGDPCSVSGTTVDGRPTITVRCTYSDQTAAIQCGSPASGAYCLPGYGATQGNTGCY